MTTAERTLANPLYVAVGAGDYAYQQVTDKLTEIRERTETAAEKAQARLEARFEGTKTRVEALPEEVPSVEELRAKLTVDELRKIADPYVDKATEFYNSLAERGEAAVEKLRTRPVVQENLTRAEKAYNDAVDLTEDALGVVSSQTRLVGDRAAKLTGRLSGKVEDAAGAIEEAGLNLRDEADDLAEEISGAAGTVEAKGRTANSSPAKKVAAAKKAPAKKAPARKAPAK